MAGNPRKPLAEKTAVCVICSSGLSLLTCCVARKSDRLPRSWPEFRDLETEVGFNGAYVGERDKILLVDKLIEDGVLGAVTAAPGVPKYHQIKLEELEPRKPRGFFEYVFEDMELFKDGYEQAIAKF